MAAWRRAAEQPGEALTETESGAEIGTVRGTRRGTAATGPDDLRRALLVDVGLVVGATRGTGAAEGWTEAAGKAGEGSSVAEDAAGWHWQGCFGVCSSPTCPHCA